MHNAIILNRETTKEFLAKYESLRASLPQPRYAGLPLAGGELRM
jgi:hypothetical protein